MASYANKYADLMTVLAQSDSESDSPPLPPPNMNRMHGMRYTTGKKGAPIKSAYDDAASASAGTPSKSCFPTDWQTLADAAARPPVGPSIKATSTMDWQTFAKKISPNSRRPSQRHQYRNKTAPKMAVPEMGTFPEMVKAQELTPEEMEDRERAIEQAAAAQKRLNALKKAREIELAEAGAKREALRLAAAQRSRASQKCRYGAKCFGICSVDRPCQRKHTPADIKASVENTLEYLLKKFKTAASYMTDNVDQLDTLLDAKKPDPRKVSKLDYYVEKTNDNVEKWDAQYKHVLKVGKCRSDDELDELIEKVYGMIAKTNDMFITLDALLAKDDIAASDAEASDTESDASSVLSESAAARAAEEEFLS